MPKIQIAVIQVTPNIASKGAAVRKLYFTQPRRRYLCVMVVRILCWAVAIQLDGSMAIAAAVTFNAEFIGEADPTPGSEARHCGDLWAEGDYAYIGSDRPGRGDRYFRYRQRS